MVSDLRDMREHEEQLMRWLGQKERMLDVLGPVAMEPAMLASQLEQVKVRARHITHFLVSNSCLFALFFCHVYTYGYVQCRIWLVCLVL